MHDIRYDEVHDEIWVTNPFARAILVFRGAAQGEEAPLRIIQGPKTQLLGTGSEAGGIDRLDVDPVHDEIVIPNRDRILVFPREAEGDVAPIRIIQGPDTRLNRASAIAVDPIHNRIIVGVNPKPVSEGVGKSGEPAALLIYDRTANGNVKPLAAIEGPRTGLRLPMQQITVYPPTGWIVIPISTGAVEEPEGPFVGFWSIHDNGNVPPRWRLAGPKSRLGKPRGVTLNPKDKELIVPDRLVNGVFTFYFPEIF